MKVGDPRKATILMLIAAGAIGFAVIQAIPGSGGPNALSTGTQPEGGSGERGQGLPSALSADPFSHPALSTQVSQADSEAARVAAQAAGGARPMPLGGSLGIGLDGGAPGSKPQLPFALPDGIRLDKAAGPVNSTGPDRQLNLGRSVSIQVQAVLKIGESKAYLSVGGDEPKPFRAGDWVAKGLRLVSVNDDGVVLGRFGKSFRLSVGGTREL